MKVALKIYCKGKVQEQILSLGQMVALGRSSKCEVQVDDEKMSGRHCRLYLKNDRLEITDLDSKNGTYLNGIRIEHSELFVGDEVKMGDTIITCEEKNSDSEAVAALTFPGPFKERLGYELKADFTGARIQNQIANKKLSVTPKVNYEASHNKEIDLRKKIKSKIKLSKQEIRSRNKITSMLALMLDVALLFFIMCVPVWIVARLVPGTATKDQKLIFLLVLEGVGAVMFLILNFKVAKFTLGERLSGIQKLYTNQ